MDSRSSIAVVTICPLVLLMDNQSAGSFSFEYLQTHKTDQWRRQRSPFCVYKYLLILFSSVCAYIDCQQTHTHTHSHTITTAWPSHSLILHWLFYQSLQPTLNLTSFLTPVCQALKSITSLVKHCYSLCVCCMHILQEVWFCGRLNCLTALYMGMYVCQCSSGCVGKLCIGWRQDDRIWGLTCQTANWMW